jgi:hypothetical protein
MGTMLMGAFKEPAQADKALRELETHGYSPEQISAISSSDKYEDRRYDTSGSVGKSAGSGAVTGGVIGGLAGLLAGVGVVPAIAGLFIGGPIVAALGLAGAAAATATGAVTGAAAGGLIGALMGLGVSKETATTYEDIVKEGGVLIGLTGREDITGEAKAILERCGAQDVNIIDMKDAGLEATGADASDMRDSRAEAMRPANTRPQPAFGETPEATGSGDTLRRDNVTRHDSMDAPAQSSHSEEL